MTIGTQQRLIGLGLSGAAAMVLLAGLAGCEVDSFLDPSLVGRWEMTPTVMPILDRLSSIEDEPMDLVRSEPIQPQDLIPEVEQYRFGPGDSVQVIIRDFVAPGSDEKFDEVIDSRGYIYITKLAPLRAAGRTNTELVQAVREAVRDAGIRTDLNAVVTVNITSQRSQTFSILGAVQTQQEFFIPKPDYRLLAALSTAGGFNETVDTIYVIRQVGLSDEASGRMPVPEGEGRPAAAPVDPTQPRPPKDVIELLNKFANPKEQKPSPGMWAVQPEPRPLPAVPPSTPRTPPVPVPAPAIDLPDARGGQGPASAPSPLKSDWTYQNGQWVKNGGVVVSTGEPVMPGAGSGTPAARTQRVIAVPVARLLAGDAEVNIVIRPGDVIRVPPPKTGVIYLGGQIARPGAFTLSGDTKLTLLRSLDSAGGLSAIAIPERTDITRVVGPGRQATIRLNLRAIGEQTQPDIYLKADDRINIGTNFWAFPLAVVRGGFRASYGYGFILDRNFSGEVFGPDQSLNR